jgi:hypothetical protein
MSHALSKYAAPTLLMQCEYATYGVDQRLYRKLIVFTIIILPLVAVGGRRTTILGVFFGVVRFVSKISVVPLFSCGSIFSRQYVAYRPELWLT